MFGLSRMSPVQIIALLIIGALLVQDHLLQLISNPMYFLALVLALLVGITVHEASHATVAVALGDPTPHRMGRVSLNPLRHLDPLGTVFMLIAGFGWGKPVLFDPRHIKIDPRLGSALVSVAGPVSNIVVATLTTIVVFALLNQPPSLQMLTRLVRGSLPTADPLIVVLASILAINVLLAAFNLIPIPPLDGFGFVINLLPRSVAAAIEPIAQYGPIILLAIIMLGPVFHMNILGQIMGPISDAIVRLIYSGVSLIPS